MSVGIDLEEQSTAKGASSSEWEYCPVERTLSMLAGKWKPIILFHLMSGTKRFNQLCRLMPRATQQMLITQLKQLEADGIIQRVAYPVIPPKVEYSLTDLGRELIPIFEKLLVWGEMYASQHVAATTKQTCDD